MVLAVLMVTITVLPTTLTKCGLTRSLCVSTRSKRCKFTYKLHDYLKKLPKNGSLFFLNITKSLAKHMQKYIITQKTKNTTEQVCGVCGAVAEQRSCERPATKKDNPTKKVVFEMEM